MIKNRGISQEAVFNAATKIAVSGIMPTTASIRAELRRGSETTLHKYLQEWKTLLLKHAGRLSQNTNLSILDENKLLRGNLETIAENLSACSRDLLNQDQTNADLMRENSNLKVENQEQAMLLASLKVENTSMQELISKLSSERAEIIEQIIADKNRLIESLRDELKQVQVEALEKIRDYSFKDRDLLIAEQIKNQNLELDVQRLRNAMGSLTYTPAVESVKKPAAKNARTQLLSEIYAIKDCGITSVEDNDAADI